MLSELVSLFASALMLFDFAFPKESERKLSPAPETEPVPAAAQRRTNDEITGAGGSVFYVSRPDKSALNTVYGTDFGMSPGSADNYPAFVSALDFCRKNPGTRLVLPEGTYYLVNSAPIVLDGMTDTLIEGENATLVFSVVTTGFSLTGCDCVEFNGITFDWDWKNKPLSDIAVIKNASAAKNSFDFVFPFCDDVGEDMIIAAVSECDKNTYTFGAPGSNKEWYVYMNPDVIKSVTKTAPSTLHIEHDGSFDSVEDGDTFIIRHYVYDAGFMSIAGGSKNVTADNIRLYGYPGSGFCVSGKASHFQIINSYIGVNPEMKGRYFTSLGADAVHCVNTNGHFLIANNDISGQGDDALNVHDGLGRVTQVSGKEIILEGNGILTAPGDTLSFFDSLFNETGVSAVIESESYDSATFTHKITFNRDVSAEIKTGYIARSLSCDSGNYVVRDNYFHENRARGLLLQSSDGLCENNRFYKTEMQAIKIIMDISPGLWYEGTGADRIIVSGNVFDTCNVMGTDEVITIGSNIAGEHATSKPFTNIEITDNSFISPRGAVLNADNVNGLVFSGNHVEDGVQAPDKSRVTLGKYSANTVFSGNEWVNSPMGNIVKSKNVFVWIRANSGNKIC